MFKNKRKMKEKAEANLKNLMYTLLLIKFISVFYFIYITCLYKLCGLSLKYTFHFDKNPVKVTFLRVRDFREVRRGQKWLVLI